VVLQACASWSSSSGFGGLGADQGERHAVFAPRSCVALLLPRRARRLVLGSSEIVETRFAAKLWHDELPEPRVGFAGVDSQSPSPSRRWIHIDALSLAWRRS